MISQTDFASELRVSRAQLLNYESGISPVPWPVVRMAFKRFELNPRWLFCEKPPQKLDKWATLKDPDPDRFNARALFSKVYSEVWRDDVEHATLNMVTMGFRAKKSFDTQTHMRFELAAQGWLQRVPPGREREFMLELSSEAERLLKELGATDDGPPKHTDNLGR